MKIGFIGLGKMGSRMTEKLLKDGHEVVAWNRSAHPLKTTDTIQNLIQNLKAPRVIWVMVSAGEATTEILTEVEKYVEKNDTIIDGGNAHFADTQKRYEEFGEKGIRYLGIGVSGGIIAATEGYPLMVGGDRSAYEHIRPILDSLSKPCGGHDYFGLGGAGHYVKMIHNGIEYGYMQSLGEGFGVLEKSEYNFDLVKVAKLYQKGTLVSGFMLDRTVEALEDPEMKTVKGIISESGEAKWTVEEAKKNNLPVDVIETSLEFRRKSQTDECIQNSFAAKLVAGLRKAFGGHGVRKI